MKPRILLVTIVWVLAASAVFVPTLMAANQDSTAADVAERKFRGAKTKSERNAALQDLANLALDQDTQAKLKIDRRIAKLAFRIGSKKNIVAETQLHASRLLLSLPNSKAGFSQLRRWLKSNESSFKKIKRPDYGPVVKDANRIGLLPDLGPKFESGLSAKMKRALKEQRRKTAALEKKYSRLKKHEAKFLDAGRVFIATLAPLYSIRHEALQSLLTKKVRLIFERAPALRHELMAALVDAKVQPAVEEVCYQLSVAKHFVWFAELQSKFKFSFVFKIDNLELAVSRTWPTTIRQDLKTLITEFGLSAIPCAPDPVTRGGRKSKSKNGLKPTLESLKAITGPVWSAWFKTNKSKLPKPT